MWSEFVEWRAEDENIRQPLKTEGHQNKLELVIIHAETNS